MEKSFLDKQGVNILWNQIDKKFITTENLTTVINTIDKIKADTESPKLTGLPTAPTAALGTRTEQIATTEYVHMVADNLALSSGNAAQIVITITPAANATATLVNTTSGNTFTGTADSNGVIAITVNEYGVFNISYQSSGAISSVKSIIINSPGQTYYVNATYATSKTYTAIIDLANSNPLTCITYEDDAIEMVKGSNNWDNQIIFKDINPCVFKNGQVVYYLDKNNFNFKTDGTPALLDGTDGDVMIEFPKFAYRIYKMENKIHVSITNDPAVAASDHRYHYYAFSKNTEGDVDHFYWGTFKGSLDSSGNLASVAGKAPAVSKTIGTFKTLAQNKGEGYTITSYMQLIAIQCLYIIKYGNLNGQLALGQGISGRSVTITDANYGPLETGGTLSFPAGAKMYYGSTSNNGSNSDYEIAKLGHVKFAGIEDFWGNIWEWIDGLTTDSNRNIITNWDYDGIAQNSNYTFTTELTENKSGQISNVAGTTEAGFMNTAWSGSSTTYFCDYGYLYAGCVLKFGGRWHSGANCGPFSVDASHGASNANAAVGARLMYL